MSRSVPILVGLLVAVPQSTHAEDFAGAEIVRVAQGMVSFKYQVKTTRLPVALSLKIYDDQGKAVDVVTGTARYLLPGNKVDIKTNAKAEPARKSKTKSKSGSSGGDGQIVEIRFVSGKVAELPKTPDPAKREGLNLRPDPNFKGNVFGGDGVKTDPYWIQYIRTAKVGDFVEYDSGFGEREPHRIEAIEVGKDYVIIAKVWYMSGTRQEQREKHRAPPASAGTSTKPGKKARETQELVVDGKKLVCDVETSGGKPNRWKSTEVPFDGLVRYDVRGEINYILTKFGRGE